MIKSIQIDLAKPPNQDLLILLKESRKLLEQGGTIEIISPTKMHIASYEGQSKAGEASLTDLQALEKSPIGQMLREAGFKGNFSMSRRGHLGSESTHIIAAV